MNNLTSLLEFVQEKHLYIHSVSFQHFIKNQVRCNIVFRGRLDSSVVSLINIFISEFNAKLCPSFSDDNIAIYVIVELNK